MHCRLAANTKTAEHHVSLDDSLAACASPGRHLLCFRNVETLL